MSRATTEEGGMPDTPRGTIGHRCPACRCPIRLKPLAETVICRMCGWWGHPEHLLP